MMAESSSGGTSGRWTEGGTRKGGGALRTESEASSPWKTRRPVSASCSVRPGAAGGNESCTAYGHKNVIFPLWSKLRAWGYQPATAGAPAHALTILHTPGNIHHNEWNALDPAFVRNVESFSQGGNSEGPSSCAGHQDLDVSLPPELLNDEPCEPRPPSLSPEPEPVVSA